MPQLGLPALRVRRARRPCRGFDSPRRRPSRARLAGAAAAHRYSKVKDPVDARLDATFFKPARTRHGADGTPRPAGELTQLRGRAPMPSNSPLIEPNAPRCDVNDASAPPPARPVRRRRPGRVSGMVTVAGVEDFVTLGFTETITARLCLGSNPKQLRPSVAHHCSREPSGSRALQNPRGASPWRARPGDAPRNEPGPARSSVNASS
jgi:hypothetical protein